MAMARQAPFSHYERKRFISDHAVARMRERLNVPGKTEFRSDRDIGNWIDETVDIGIKEGKSREITFPDGERQLMVDLSWRDMEGKLWAVVKPDAKNPQKQAVVTCLIGEAAESAFAAAAKAPAKLGDVLGAKLRAMMPDVPNRLGPPPAAAAAQPPKPPAPPAPQMPSPAMSAIQPPLRPPAKPSEPSEPRLVTWGDDTAEVDAGTVAAKIDELLDTGVEPEHIRVWRPVRLRFRPEVEE